MYKNKLSKLAKHGFCAIWMFFSLCLFSFSRFPSLSLSFPVRFYSFLKNFFLSSVSYSLSFTLFPCRTLFIPKDFFPSFFSLFLSLSLTVSFTLFPCRSLFILKDFFPSFFSLFLSLSHRHFHPISL